jgi:hypothetical protein
MRTVSDKFTATWERAFLANFKAQSCCLKTAKRPQNSCFVLPQFKVGPSQMPGALLLYLPTQLPSCFHRLFFKAEQLKLIIQTQSVFVTYDKNQSKGKVTYSFSSSLNSSKLLFFFSLSRFFPGRSGFRSPSSRAYSCARSAVVSLSASSESRDCGL